MNAEWKDRLLRTIRETEETIRKNENDEHARKILELTKELEAKNKEIEDLKAQREALERQVQSESNDAKVLSLTVTNSPNPSRLYISVKLNIREMSRVIATFERFDYTIHNVVFDSEQLDDYKERYENLLRFLNL